MLRLTGPPTGPCARNKLEHARIRGVLMADEEIRDLRS